MIISPLKTAQMLFHLTINHDRINIVSISYLSILTIPETQRPVALPVLLQYSLQPSKDPLAYQFAPDPSVLL